MVSRSTNRPKQVDVCWQKVKRDKVAKTPKLAALFPSPSGLSLKAARVRRIGRPIAWKVISNFEWLGTLPPCSDYFGLFFGDYCGGVACYSIGSAGSAMMMGPYLGVTQRDIAYLCRGACVHWCPSGAAPKLINVSARIAHESTGAKIAIAYSDTDAGEIGTVYQAAGWVCMGLGVKDWQWVTPSGATRNRSTTRDVVRRNGCTWGEAIKALIAAGWRQQPVNPKWRYVKILGTGADYASLLKRVNSLRVPYPKRKIES